MKKSKDMKNCHFIFCLTILIGLKNPKLTQNLWKTPEMNVSDLELFRKPKIIEIDPVEKKLHLFKDLSFFSRKKNDKLGWGMSSPFKGSYT